MAHTVADAWSRPREHIARICASTNDTAELRQRLVEELRRVLGFDAYAFLLTDPETSVGSTPLADLPFLSDLTGELPGLIRLKYLASANRWTALPDHAPVGLLSAAPPGGTPHDAAWRERLGGYDVADIASTVFRDRYGCWGFLDLWRCGNRTDGGRFGRAEAVFLAEIAGPVTAALRRAQAATFAGRPGAAIGAPSPPPRPSPPHQPPVVLLLSPDLRVVGQTPPARDYLRVLVPPAPDRAPIPASAYNVAAQLLAAEAGVDPGPPTARVHFADGLWLTLRAARIGDTADDVRRDIAVTIEAAPPADRIALFRRAYGLSPREGELLALLASGHATQQVAAAMCLSEHTVQDHLKSIFAKTAVRTRRALVARALGG